MPYAAGDWICRSCWKSNRPHDELCYRCRTPRLAGEASGTHAASIRGDHLIPPFLVTLPAAFLRIYAVVSLVSVGFIILLLIASLLAVASPARSGVVNVVVALALLLIQVAIIWGLLAAARAITEHRRWGYVVGLVMTMPSAVAGVGAVFAVPDLMELEWLAPLAWFGIGYYGILALLSLAALAASFVRREVTSEEAGSRGA